MLCSTYQTSSTFIKLCQLGILVRPTRAILTITQFCLPGSLVGLLSHAYQAFSLALLAFIVLFLRGSLIGLPSLHLAPRGGLSLCLYRKRF